jgi:hypothetical protein
MKDIKRFLAIFSFLGLFPLFLNSPSSALDPQTGIQDPNRPSSTGKIRVPFSTQETLTKQQPTADQKFSTIFSKLAALEQTVATLHNKNTAQAQHIAQLQQVISVQSGGTVTIQAPGTLKLTAGGTLKMAGSKIDVQAPITGVHGMLKADTMITTTVIAQTYTPGAGNIW